MADSIDPNHAGTERWCNCCRRWITKPRADTWKADYAYFVAGLCPHCRSPLSTSPVPPNELPGGIVACLKRTLWRAIGRVKCVIIRPTLGAPPPGNGNAMDATTAHRIDGHEGLGVMPQRDNTATSNPAVRYSVTELRRMIRPISRLAYHGPVDVKSGKIDARDERDWAFSHAVVVLKRTFPRWEEFAFEDYAWSWCLASASELLLHVDFHRLSRPDKNFVFRFDLREPDVRCWMAFLLRAKKLGIINGPRGSWLTAVSITVDNALFQEAVRRNLVFHGGT